jgi:RNA polymerase sigma-70 factor, ECF subfamily
VDDETLAGLLATDLDGAFDALVRTYQDRLFAFALRMTGSRRHAEEIAQDAFVRAYRALARYPSDRVAALRPRAWLFQIAANVARNRARGRRLHEISLTPADLDAPILDPPDDPAGRPEATVVRDEARAELAGHVLRLPERYRAAVVLRHVHGFGYREVATVLGQPVGTVKANVHRGVAMLRRSLEGERAEPAAERARADIGSAARVVEGTR